MSADLFDAVDLSIYSALLSAHMIRTSETLYYAANIRLALPCASISVTFSIGSGRLNR
jgi:hypothetical protein